MVPLLHSVVILANSYTAGLHKDCKKGYQMLHSKFQTTKPNICHEPVNIKSEPRPSTCQISQSWNQGNLFGNIGFLEPVPYQ